MLRQYTDTNGRTQFTLIAGGYLLTVRKSCYRDFSASLEFPGGDVDYTVSLTPITVSLPLGISLRGVIAMVNVVPLTMKEVPSVVW